MLGLSHNGASPAAFNRISEFLHRFGTEAQCAEAVSMVGNLKTTLASAFHSLKYRKYAQHSPLGFAFRFNRRFDLRGLVARHAESGYQSSLAFHGA